MCEKLIEPIRRPYHVLVGHGQQVALLVAELVALLRHSLHGSCHVIVALGLLRQLGFLHQVILVHVLGFRKKEQQNTVSVWTPDNTTSFERKEKHQTDGQKEETKI